MANLEVHLITAVQDGNINEVRSLLEKGANINVFTTGRTPLAIAARQGNVPMLELLLNCGHFKQNAPKSVKKKCNKNETRKSDHTAVKKRKAVEGNNGYYEVIYDDKSDDSDPDVNRNISLDDAETPEGMDSLEWDAELDGEGEDSIDFEDAWSDQYRWYAKILADSCWVNSDLPYSCDVNLQDSVGRCAIHYAAEYGHVNAVKVLLNAGCKADIGDVDSLTPLHLAANGGHNSVVETLLTSGCSVNAKTTDKLSPLHYAAARGFTDVVNTLLDSGARVDSLDSSEKTPLILAVSRNLPEVAEVLVKRGARVNIEDIKGFTAMCEAVWQKSVPMVKMLLDAGAKVVPTHYLVHQAVLHRHLEMVRTLLEAGALVNIRDSKGETPLIIAAVGAQPDMVDLLLAHGAIVDYAGGCSDKTPLYCAATMSERQCPRVLKSLVEAGANLERETYGQTPLSAALYKNRIRSAIALVALGAKMRQSMPLVRRTGSITLARAFVAAGYDLNQSDCDMRVPSKWPVEPQNVHEFLQQAKYNPLSLAELSRIVVRSQAVGVMSTWVSSLCVPSIITRYLMLNDYVNATDFEMEPTHPIETVHAMFLNPADFDPSHFFNSLPNEDEGGREDGADTSARRVMRRDMSQLLRIPFPVQ